MSHELEHPDEFIRRHIGPDEHEQEAMLDALKTSSLSELMDQTVPAEIRLARALAIPAPVSERDALDELRVIGRRNKIFRSFIGMGYSDCITPPVILRNILENPGWYTAYTP